MDVADWLRTLGLERYEAAFRENDVELRWKRRDCINGGLTARIAIQPLM